MKNAVLVAVAVILGFAVIAMIRGNVKPAPTPAVFAEGTSLDDAISLSKETGKPVYAVVTATWCGPCQRLKSTTLVDPQVESWIKEHTIPVYLDADENREEAGRLGVTGIPATFILKDGQIAASTVGYADANHYLAFLKGSTGG